MALIECAECGKKISEYAELCSDCGHPTRIMEQPQDEFIRKGMFPLLSTLFGESDIPVPEKGFPSKEYAQLFDDILAALTPFEEAVIRWRFGFNDGCVHTHAELSSRYEISEERICQMESAALLKLRHDEDLAVMWEFPLLESLKQEAENRGYVAWKEAAIEPPGWWQSGFSRCCFRLLNMYDPSQDSILLRGPIENLDLSVRSYNCLKRANIKTIADLVALSFSDLLNIRNLNAEYCDEIVEKLSSMGLELRKESAP